MKGLDVEFTFFFFFLKKNKKKNFQNGLQHWKMIPAGRRTSSPLYSNRVQVQVHRPEDTPAAGWEEKCHAFSAFYTHILTHKTLEIMSKLFCLFSGSVP